MTHPAGSRTNIRPRAARALILSTAACALTWLLFTGSTNPHELAIGAVSILLTVTFCSLMIRSEGLPIAFPWHGPAQAWRIPGNLAIDCWTVLRVLLQDLTGPPQAGTLQTAPFRAGNQHPEREARAVLAITYMTMTPNSIVLGVDPSRSLILYHQLERTEVPSLVRELG